MAAPSLAVAGWGTPPGVALDLRYAPEEAGWLDPRPADVWRAVVREAGDLGAQAAGRYPVDDPYGGERGAAAVARCFGVALAPAQVTFGAGVTGLLHGLAALGRGGTVLAPPHTHPDLGAWARALGARVVTGPLEPASVVHLDRPAFGGEVMALAELASLAERVAEQGGVVIVDEAPAPYLPPAESAIALVGSAANLVVLRGFTKAYSLGGMRVGFAVASAAVAERVRAVLPPLQVGELGFAVALRLLEAGDVCARLRERIHAVKPVVASLLADAGLAPDPGHPDVPALVLDDGDGRASGALAACGIRALGFGPPAIVHLRIPVADGRIAALAAALARPIPGRRWRVSGR